ncbi:MAG: hypothetical protein QXW70_03365 [Candidatus Anstonellales archaeon]
MFDFLEQMQEQQRHQERPNLYSLVEKKLFMSKDALELLRQLLEGKRKSIDLFFGADSKSEFRRDKNFSVIEEELSKYGISCKKDTVYNPDEKKTYYVLSITNLNVQSQSSAKKEKFFQAKPDKIATKTQVPSNLLSQYAGLVSLFGEEFVSSVLSVSRTADINPLTLFLVICAEQTAYRKSLFQIEAELNSLGKALKKDPNSRNYSSDIKHIPPNKEPSWSLVQMKKSTFDDLGFPFSFEEMKNDYKKSLLAAATYLKHLEKRLQRIEPTITTYSNPRLIAAAYIKPAEAERSARLSNDWMTYYQQNKSWRIRQYFSKVDSYYTLLKEKLEREKEVQV